MIKKYLYILFFIFIGLKICGFAQSVAPLIGWFRMKQKEKYAPFSFTAETVKSGENVFQKNCKSCHGEPWQAELGKDHPPSGGSFFRRIPGTNGWRDVFQDHDG